MKTLNADKLSSLQGSGFWTDFTDGACAAVGTADVVVTAAALAGTTIGAPLAIGLLITTGVCAGWTWYRLS